VSSKGSSFTKTAANDSGGKSMKKLETLKGNSLTRTWLATKSNPFISFISSPIQNEKIKGFLPWKVLSPEILYEFFMEIC